MAKPCKVTIKTSKGATPKEMTFEDYMEMLYNGALEKFIADGTINTNRLGGDNPFGAKTPEPKAEKVKERGNNFSTGQRQLVSFARTIVHKPKVMILDEATSHLDNEGEVLVQNALDAAMKNRTSLVIAHRLSTIRDADRIVVLDNGTIIEQGTHEQLMNNNSLYAAQVRAGETFEA